MLRKKIKKGKMKNKIVTFGEVMMRLSTPGFSRFGQQNQWNINFGGAEANAAVSLANYGLNTQFVSRLPQNDIADACIRELKGLGVDTGQIIRGGERMGIYFVEKGAVARAGKVIYDRAHSSFSTIEPAMLNWKSILENASWFHWSGITPAVSESAAEICLKAIKAANEFGVTVSCDLNYRKKLWKYGKEAIEVMPKLVAGTDILMGNEEDAEMCLGIKPENTDISKGEIDAEAYMVVSRKIMDQFPRLKKVITTLRESISASHNNWSGVIWNGQELLKSKTYQITHIVDRVGCGDAFMGGLIYGLTQLETEQEALEFAAAASALKHTIEGDYNRVTLEEVNKLMGGDASGRVVR
jgi:2-dehydro-3-deoxygluconokinase